jgi:hypothetical protein
MAPLEPRQHRPVRREAGCRVEVGPAHERRHLTGHEVDAHEGVLGLAVPRERLALVVLADVDGPGAHRLPVAQWVGPSVGEPPPALRRERLDDARRGDPMEPTGREVRYEDRVRVDEGGSAAVLVDACPGVEALRREARHRAVTLATDEDLPPALVGATLEPPADPVPRADLREEDHPVGQAGRRDRRRPASERRDLLRALPLPGHRRPTSRAARS